MWAFIKKTGWDAISIVPFFLLPVIIYSFMQVVSPGPLTQQKTIIIQPGASLNQIAHKLKSEKIITNSLTLKLAAYVLGHSRDLHAGEYAFAPGVSVQHVVRQLSSGDVLQHQLTVPEGLLKVQILELVEGSSVLAEKMPDSQAYKEGDLFPDTYAFTRDYPRKEILRRMHVLMEKQLAEAWAARDRSIPLKSPAELVVLASIIEKETGNKAERAKVAGVFYNRLKKRMRLGSCATVIYALTGGKPFERVLTRDDLRLKHPYNTYVNSGLPPGPICSPGLAALEAAAHPESIKALYFVSDGKGKHVFSNSLKQHTKHFFQLRKIRLSN